jgi:Amt family ammonium transporter
MQIAFIPDDVVRIENPDLPYSGKGPAMLTLTKTFAAQMSVGAFLSDLFYILATLGNLLAIIGFVFLDAGMVKRKHLIDTLVQKLISAFVAGVAFMVVGYGIWNWQFDQAFGVPNALAQSLSDWSIFGPDLRSYAQNLDPAITPGADTLQIFVVFFFCYAGMVGALIHSIGIERLKPSACYVLAAIGGGLMMPILAYLTWGPVGPLTNLGLHDFVGAFSLYMLIGVWGIILSWRLGARRLPIAPLNGPLFAMGTVFLLVAIPLFAIGCGFFEPGSGYFGIANTNSGLGIVVVNLFMAFGGGALSGAVIGYRKRAANYAFLGPIAGYIACSAVADIAAPWECLLFGMAGPVLMALGGMVMARLKIDDQKIVPLTLAPAIFSALMAGIVGKGLPTGGMVGATGVYSFQHAHLGFGIQLVGVAVTLAISAVSGLILVFLLEKTIGLRVAPQVEEFGADEIRWSGVPAARLEDQATPLAQGTI